MTKRILLVPFLLGLFLSSNSQVTKFEYGFSGGLNINSASGTGIDKSHKGTLTGLSIGGHFK